MASWAASWERLSPSPKPVPIRAGPLHAMIVRTSAKSTFTSPVTRIRSEMPWVAFSRTSSAFFSASRNEVPFGTTASSRSLGTTIIVSTHRRSSCRPSIACRSRFFPSKENGRVTTPMTSAPMSRAISATMGAAPVPVPPPMPAVTNTRSAPSSAPRTSSSLSESAWRPISGRAPAPRPRVSFFPIWIVTCERALFRACASVFIEMNSTPSRSSSIIRFTALPPAPPTPTTFMRAFRIGVSSNSKIIMVATPS